MSNGLENLPQYIKRGLAATLFTVMLVGSCAAALSALAAAVSTLSGNYSSGERQMALSTQVPASTSTAAPTEHVSDGTQATGTQATPLPQPKAASVNVMDELNAKVDRMHSPIQQTLDYGGVVLGDKVQQSFGQLLSGLLQTLFVDQSPPSQQGDAN
ncbi:hypothetical protein [Alicyclobacillus pomorum]|jgi:hypothetical protein|uniref:hypothetical protein n=1 Tax=Alicyclobacillus pomorum TaxID=204470 RepID=UPI0004092AFD|nr:hypothetical protein [Alicyclobacillus pomorum]